MPGGNHAQVRISRIRWNIFSHRWDINRICRISIHYIIIVPNISHHCMRILWNTRNKGQMKLYQASQAEPRYQYMILMLPLLAIRNDNLSHQKTNHIQLHKVLHIFQFQTNLQDALLILLLSYPRITTTIWAF